MRILRKRELILRRPDAGYFNSDKNWVQSTTDTNFFTSIQPDFAGSFEKILPEGVRNTDCRVLHTQTELITASEKTGVLADVVVIDGLEYEVLKFFPWFDTYSTRLWHHQALLVLKDKLT